MILCPICILTINFLENLQEYFFCLESVFNHKKMKKNANILSKLNILVFFLIFYELKLKNVKIFNKF